MNLEQAVFDDNKTLWEVLDAQNVTNVSTEIARVNEQLVTLGRTVDNNQILLNDRVTLLDTKVDDNVISITALTTRVNSVVMQVAELVIKVDNAVVDAEAVVASVEPRITAIEQELASLTDTIISTSGAAYEALRLANQALGTAETAAVDAGDAFRIAQDGRFDINRLIANQYRFNLIRGTNQYFFGWKPTSTSWSSRRITFNVSETTIINSNVNYTCTVLENGVSSSRVLRICADHDSFASTGIVTYPMLLGSCRLLFQTEQGNGVYGYMTIL